MVLKHNLRKLFKGNSRLMKITECLEDLDSKIGGSSSSGDLESDLEALLDAAIQEETDSAESETQEETEP